MPQHEHEHTPGGAQGSKAFALGIGLNLVFVGVEAAYGLASRSIALVADAAHNFSDVLGLSLAWGAALLAARKPTARRTYGFRKGTVLSALANAVLLLVTVGGVAWEAIGRFQTPQPIESRTVMWVAGIGVVINGLSALLFVKDSGHDINIKGALLHLLADAAVSLGVVAVGFVVLRTGFNWLDPAASLAISLVILMSTWGLLKESLNLTLDAVPEHIEPDEVLRYFEGLPEVQSVHDLHIWAMSSTEVALTVHLVAKLTGSPPPRLPQIRAELEARFRVQHATVQLELPGDCGHCSLI